MSHGTTRKGKPWTRDVTDAAIVGEGCRGGSRLAATTRSPEFCRRRAGLARFAGRLLPRASASRGWTLAGTAERRRGSTIETRDRRADSRREHLPSSSTLVRSDDQRHSPRGAGDVFYAIRGSAVRDTCSAWLHHVRAEFHGRRASRRARQTARLIVMCSSPPGYEYHGERR